MRWEALKTQMLSGISEQGCRPCISPALLGFSYGLGWSSLGETQLPFESAVSRNEVFQNWV